MLITTARADAVMAEFRERHGVEMLAKPYYPNSLASADGGAAARPHARVAGGWRGALARDMHHAVKLAAAWLCAAPMVDLDPAPF
jgi:hypothetical protein